MSTSKMIEVLNELSGEVGIGSILGTMFRYMQIVEDIVNEKMAQYPEESDMIYHSFGLFAGDEQNMFSKFDDRVFEHHVRELLDRVGTGQIKTKEQREAATLSEILAGVVEASLRGPLAHEYHLLQCHLFTEIMGEDTMKKLFSDQYEREESLADLMKGLPWPGWLDEELASLRRKRKGKREFPTRKVIKQWLVENPESKYPWMEYKQSEPVQLEMV